MPSSTQTATAECFSSDIAAGVRAYGRATQAVLTPVQASIQVHERLCQELIAAKAAYEARRLDNMCRHTKTCMRALMILHGAIKFEPGNKGRVILGGLYLHIFDRVRTVLQNSDVSVEFDELIVLMQRFCRKMLVAAPRRASIGAAQSQ
jgi:flagellin-specific chaperone FliS